MATDVAFLRAINVGGRGILAMSALRRIFETAGCAEVTTYIQSGNVLYSAPRSGGAALRARIDRGLARHMGREVGVAYRSARELEEAVDAAPFGDFEEGPDLKLYLAFLIGTPKKRLRLPLAVPRDGLEVIHATRSEVYVVSRRIAGRYGFPNLLIEKELAVPATSRNWNTVRKMLALTAGGT